MTTPKRRGRAVSAGHEYRAGGSAASGQTPHNCAWISNVLSPSDHLAPDCQRGLFDRVWEPAAPDNQRPHAGEAGDFRLKPRLHRTRNRKVESISLQQRVSNKPGAATTKRNSR